MTFLEAAVEVLRREGKPLHFKELTRLAIKYDLLSVVGRDPESMMQTRLQAEVRRPSSDLVRTIPGVFGLRAYPPKSGRGEPARVEGGTSAGSKSAATGGAQLELPSSGEAAAKGAGRERGGRRRGRGGRPAEGSPTSAGSAAPSSPTGSAAAGNLPAGEPALLASAVSPANRPGSATPPAAGAAPADKDAGRGKRRRRGSGRSGEAAPPGAVPTPGHSAAPPVAPSAPAAPSAASPAPAAVASPAAATSPVATSPGAATPPVAATPPAAVALPSTATPAAALPSAAPVTLPVARPPSPPLGAGEAAAPVNLIVPPAPIPTPPAESTRTPTPGSSLLPVAAPPSVTTPAPTTPRFEAIAAAAATAAAAAAPHAVAAAPAAPHAPAAAPAAAQAPTAPHAPAAATAPHAPRAPEPARAETAAKSSGPVVRSPAPAAAPPHHRAPVAAPTQAPAPSPAQAPAQTQAPGTTPSATTPSGSAAQAAGQNQAGARTEPPPPRLMTMADAAYDVLRGSSDGRPLAFRQIAEIALKRRLLRGEPADVARALRTALVREQRQRDSEGLRPRIRTVGPGQYMLAERKLEPELYNAERELLDRLNRTREATRVALRRRLRGLPAGAFELLMRLLLERLGMLGAELIKRGEGVAYYSGQSQRGSRNQKVLVAVRPGEAELSREAVGELRAGVRLRSFDEGLLLCGGRASAAAVAEASAVPGLDVYDQDALTDLLIRNQLGVRRMQLPIDYLDAELLGELSEPS